MSQETKTTNASAAMTAQVQKINGCEVRILKSKTNGMRAAEIKGRTGIRIVPVDLLSLAAGRDAWMRDIEFKCADCRERLPAKDMECQMCPSCNEKAFAEMEELNS